VGGEGDGASGGMLFSKGKGVVQRYGVLRRKVKFGKSDLLERRFYYYLWPRFTDYSGVLFPFFDITSAFN
jgi:hypothetical protein